MTLKDSSGKKVGEIKDRGDKQVLYDANGRLQGEYDSSSNTTRDAHGRRVGTGNLLTTLL